VTGDVRDGLVGAAAGDRSAVGVGFGRAHRAVVLGVERQPVHLEHVREQELRVEPRCVATPVREVARGAAQDLAERQRRATASTNDLTGP